MTTNPTPTRPEPTTPQAATGIEREPITHELKTWQSYFHAVNDGRKRFEIRRDDRDFRVGDFLRLRETEYGSGNYTGRECSRRITYILRREDDLGLKDGFAILSLDKQHLTSEPAASVPHPGLLAVAAYWKTRCDALGDAASVTIPIDNLRVMCEALLARSQDGGRG